MRPTSSEIVAAGVTLTAAATESRSIAWENVTSSPALGATPAWTTGPNAVLATGAGVEAGTAAVWRGDRIPRAPSPSTPPTPRASPTRSAIERRSRIGT